MIYKTFNRKLKDWTRWTPLNTGSELRCSGRVHVTSSCSKCCTCRVTLVTKPVISHEWGKDRTVLTTNETQIFRNLNKAACQKQNVASPHCNEKGMARPYMGCSLPNYIFMLSYHYSISVRKRRLTVSNYIPFPMA